MPGLVMPSSFVTSARTVDAVPISAPNPTGARPMVVWDSAAGSGYGRAVASMRAGSQAPSVAVFAPGLVLHVELERDAEGAVEVHLHPGGQGYWIARMATALGARAVLCAPVGGESGEVVAHLVSREHVELRSVPLKHENGTYVHDRREGERRTLVETSSPPLGRHELDQLYNVTLAAAMETGVCIVAGSHLGAVVPAETYRRLVHDLTGTGVAAIVDLAGASLRAALGGRPDIVKISHEELIADGWSANADCDEIVDGMRKMTDAGARNVVVSRAEEPTLAYVEGALLEIGVPQLSVVDARGSGDAMTAALGVSLAQRVPLHAALARAAAAGAVSVTRHGLASGHVHTIEMLAQRARVVPIVEPNHG